MQGIGQAQPREVAKTTKYTISEVQWPVLAPIRDRSDGAAVLAAIQLRLSVILLAQLRGPGEAGQYAAAVRFIEAGRMLPQALFGALFPALSALSSDSQALDHLFRRVLMGLAAYGLLVGVVEHEVAGAQPIGQRTDGTRLVATRLVGAIDLEGSLCHDLGG